MNYDAVLFDFDGVLADSEPIHYAAWMDVLRPFDISMDWETYQRVAIGISDRLMIERLAALRTPPVPFETVWAVYPAKRDALRERLLAEPEVFHSGTLDLVRELSAILPLAVVSSSGRSEVEQPLIHIGLGAYFKAMVCGLEAGRLKPEPDPYLRAAALLGADRPLVVEDSDAGEASGRAAGFDVLRVSSPSAVAEMVRERLGLPKDQQAC